jgi:hypothetical protein
VELEPLVLGEDVVPEAEELEGAGVVALEVGAVLVGLSTSKPGTVSGAKGAERTSEPAYDVLTVYLS